MATELPVDWRGFWQGTGTVTQRFGPVTAPVRPGEQEVIRMEIAQTGTTVGEDTATVTIHQGYFGRLGPFGLAPVR